MNFRKAAILLAVFSSLSAFSGGCQSGGVGDPCTPEDEYQQAFSGFNAAEVNIESRSFQCETRVCLVNHFRGRVSCPLGQTNETANAYYCAQDPTGAAAAGITCSSVAKVSPTDPAGCRIPGQSGANALTVEVSVTPQCTTRTAASSVYCSCRCDGPDPNANYCKCPSGYACTDFPEFALGAAVAGGSAELEGKYCVKSEDTTSQAGDTIVNFKQGTCDAALADAEPTTAPSSCTTMTASECGVSANP